MELDIKIKNRNDNLQLIETYGPLLSSKKLIYIQEYFFNDLSLKEIADIHEISRSAVHEAITEGLKELENYEKKLHFIEKQQKRIKFIKNNISDKDIISKYIELEFRQDE